MFGSSNMIEYDNMKLLLHGFKSQISALGGKFQRERNCVLRPLSLLKVFLSHDVHQLIKQYRYVICSNKARVICTKYSICLHFNFIRLFHLKITIARRSRNHLFFRGSTLFADTSQLLCNTQQCAYGMSQNIVSQNISVWCEDPAA